MGIGKIEMRENRNSSKWEIGKKGIEKAGIRKNGIRENWIRVTGGTQSKLILKLQNLCLPNILALVYMIEFFCLWI